MEKHGLLSIVKKYVDIECQEGTSKTSQKGEGGKEGREGAREKEGGGGEKDERYIIMHMEGICSITKHAFPPKSTPVTWDFQPPPPPWISFPPEQIPYGKSSPSMGFLPPPLPNKIAHAVPILHLELVLEDICVPRWEGLPYGIIPPWGSSAWDFFRGRFFIWYYFRGDNLPWYFFLYHEICVGGGGGDLP